MITNGKITFIGAGNMAEAIVAGMLKQNLIAPANLYVTDISEARLLQLKEKYGVSTSLENASTASASRVVILAVKPQVFPEVWEEIADRLQPDTLVISIMAGIPTQKISGDQPIRVVRVMPNTPALIGEGAAAIAPGSHATKEDLQLAQKIMEAVGVVEEVNETEMDAVTALSGSGPAYVFYLLESMLEAAEKMGLKKEVARTLALATVKGAAQLMDESGEEAAVLRTKVTSKGGTTAAALQTLDEQKVKESIVEALLAAQARSKELARG